MCSIRIYVGNDLETICHNKFDFLITKQRRDTKILTRYLTAGMVPGSCGVRKRPLSSFPTQDTRKAPATIVDREL